MLGLIGGSSSVIDISSSSSVESNYTTNNNDSYWAIFTKYSSKDAAEKALLQVGVKIVSVTKNGKSSNVWFEYQGIDPSTNEPTRVGYKFVDGKKVRVAKKSGKTLD